MKKKVIKKFIDPVLDLLRQGTSPEQLSLAIALGISIGLFPVIGTTTIIAAIVCIAFRLNMAVIQLANYAAYPLQILLFIPFVNTGNVILGLELSFSLEAFKEAMQYNISQLFITFGHVLITASVGWLVLAVPFTLLTYYLVLILLIRFKRKNFTSMKKQGLMTDDE